MMSRQAINIVMPFCLFLIIGAIYHANKVLPEDISILGPEHTIPSESVTFLADRTYIDKAGVRHLDHEIFDEVMAMIERAQSYILIDMFLYNDFQGDPPETSRQLSDELTKALVDKKADNPDITITVITDPINIAYGGAISSHFPLLRKNDILVVTTDLRYLRDSNPIYSIWWRTFIQWFGNQEEAGYIPHPFQTDGHKVTMRSWLNLLNFKANHRKLIVVDQPEADGSVKIATLVTSANPHDGSSAHDNVAIKIEDKVWQDVIKTEQAVGNFSDAKVPGIKGRVNDQHGTVIGQVLTEGAIEKKLMERIDQTNEGDSIDMIMFYLADRTILNGLIRAAERNVNIRLVLDPNKDAFGMAKNGVPNKPVAHELLKKTNEKISIKWCYTTSEQCHSKMVLFTIDGNYTLVTGSANLTRRNIDDYNLETNILVSSEEEIPAIKAARDYFSDIWDNKDGRIFTTHYETYEDDSFIKTVLYRVQEFTGMSSF